MTRGSIWMRKSSYRRSIGQVWVWLAVALVVAGLAPALQADDAGQPARAVRLSYVDGNVKLSQDGQVIADPAVVNAPLLEGMQLATAEDGRAEIQFEDGSVARIAPNSSVTLKVLRGEGASGDAELVLNHGLGYFELQGGDQNGQIRVGFGNSVATASGFTVMRISMDTAPGDFAVFSGNAHLEGDGGLSLDLHGGESVALNAADPGNYNLAESIEPDSWDSWNSDRDQSLTSEAAAQTNAPNDLAGGNNANPAWNDLDANGNWYNVPDQGYVWSPYDASNPSFDPYGNGNWMYTPSYGYVWASGYSWGYLPFQCGAWNFYGGFGWGWAPGMGGCVPWWGAGFYGGPNIGIFPNGYRPIHRPIIPHPRNPRFDRRVMPVIAVNRHPLVLNAGLPARSRTAPVDIAGRMVSPLRPLPSHSSYEHASTAFAGHSFTSAGNETGARPSFVPSRPAYFDSSTNPAIRGYGAPARGYSAPARSYSPQVRSYSPPVRSYSPPARTYSPPPRAYSAPRSYSPPPSASGGGGGSRGGGGHR